MVTLTVSDVLQLEVLRPARLVAGQTGLHRVVRWVHIWPEVIPPFRGGELLLTTGHSWPPDPGEQRRIVKELEAGRIAAIVFATGRYFPNIPPAILETADAVGLPILQASSDMAFVDITEAINREIIRRQYDAIERSEQIHRTLTASALQAERLQDIAESLSQLIGRHVAVSDPEGRLLANTFPASPQTQLPWPVADSGAALKETVKRLVQARSPVRVEAPPQSSGRAAVACPIWVGREIVGYLWVLEAGEPLTEFDVRAAEHGAVVAGLHILRQRAVASVEARVRHTFIEALLWGDLNEDPALYERARLLGFDPDGVHAVGLAALLRAPGRERKRALADPEEFLERERLGAAVQGALESMGVRAFLAYSLNQVVFVLTLDSVGSGSPAGASFAPGILARRLWQHLRRARPETSLAVAVGGAHPGVRGVARSYAEADRALTISRGEGVFVYDDLLVLRVLDAVSDRSVLTELVERTLGPLRIAGGSSESLRQTTRALVAHGFRQRETARALKVHWNTLRHRIGRLEALWGRSLEDPELRLQLALAVAAEQLLAAGGSVSTTATGAGTASALYRGPRGSPAARPSPSQEAS